MKRKCWLFIRHLTAGAILLDWTWKIKRPSNKECHSFVPLTSIKLAKRIGIKLSCTITASCWSFYLKVFLDVLAWIASRRSGAQRHGSVNGRRRKRTTHKAKWGQHGSAAVSPPMNYSLSWLTPQFHACMLPLAKFAWLVAYMRAAISGAKSPHHRSALPQPK